FFSSRRRHTSFSRDWSSDVCSSDLALFNDLAFAVERVGRLARLDRTRGDTARENAAEERVALDGGHQHAERAFFNGRLRHVLDEIGRASLGKEWSCRRWAWL